MARRVQPDYLYRRKGSQNWWLRLQFNSEAAKISGKDEFRISMGTPDRKQAELNAAQYILHHKFAMESAKGNFVETVKFEDKKLPVGEHWQADGSKIAVSDTHIIKFGSDGSVSETTNERLAKA